MKSIAILHGHNLDRLGKREPDVYGHETLKDLEAMISTEAGQRDFSTVFFQSNHEGALIDKIHELTDTGIDAFIVNFGAYSHTSIALRDALSASAKPTIEVHISDIKEREAFRHTSMTAGACKDMICGKGFPGYIEALERLPKYL